jgi:endonuclease G
MGAAPQAENLGRILEGQETPEGDFGMPEAIVLTTGRPTLLIQGGKWEEPRLPEVKKRLDSAAGHLLKAIPKVARLELLNHPNHDYIGSAWMVDEDVMITNRHVANIFARRDHGRFVVRTTPFGEPYQAQVDFNEEYESPNKPFEVPIEEVLFIERDVGFLPDMALVRVKKVDGLPEPIALSEEGVNRNDDIAVIGYPARDSRNDPFVMQRLFKGIYEVKRLSPGRISGIRQDRFALTHDCTTLGGNSGSVVLSLASGKAVGLHFAGSYLENNFAVTSAVVREKMADLSRRVIMPVAGEERPAKATELSGRQGYDPGFLSRDVPLPVATEAVSGQITPVHGNDDGILHYTHFSVVMHRGRRLALYTACNIDGGSLYNIRRGRDKWGFDPRVETEYQAGKELYYKNRLDRGHLVRRLDPAWGDTREEAVRAAEDTFYYTNSMPQHSHLNQRSWLSLEDYILDHAATHDLKVSVFTGPAYNRYDRDYRGFKIPQEYWKVVVIVNAFSDELSATGYLLTQADLMNDLEFAYGEFKTYQIPIREIEGKTGLAFGDLPAFDPFGQVESVGAGVRVVEGPDDLVL